MLLDFGDGYSLRPAAPDDHAALGLVCLRTGDSGKDATAQEDDPDLLGLIYAVPYQVLSPEHAFVVEGPHGVCGYILGTPDSPGFYGRMEREWFPPIRNRIHDPGPDSGTWRGSDWARRAIHYPRFVYPQVLHPFPAHGHIDLLAEARGRQIGTRAMQFLMQRLRHAGTPGLHLQVSPRNRSAIKFYKTLGFRRLVDPSLPRDTVFMVTAL